MKLKTNILIICCSCLCLVSCSDKETKPYQIKDSSDPDTASIIHSDDNTISDDDQIYTMPDEYYVEYAVPDVIDIPVSTITEFNTMLKEKGYDFGLKIISIEFENYLEELKKYSPDIAFIGFNDIDSDNTEQTIASGYYEPLDDYLANSIVYSQISPKLWDSVKYNGNIYTIPNCSAQDLPVSIVFNLDKIRKETAESFSGEISEIKDILGTGTLLYQIRGFDFSEYYGYDHSKGVLISQNKEIELPYKSEKCMEWLKTVNELYLNNSATDDEESDWSICITKDVERITDKHIYVYSPKAIITTRYSASTGILATSDNKDNAFKVLELLHSDSDLANCLIYGTGFTEKEGYAINENGEKMDGYINKLIFGLDENLLWSQDYLLHFPSYKEKLDYYNENVLESPAMDIQISTDTSSIQALLANESDIWKKIDIDEELKKMEIAYDENNVQRIISEIDSKIK